MVVLSDYACDEKILCTWCVNKKTCSFLYYGPLDYLEEGTLLITINKIFVFDDLIISTKE